MRTPHTNNLHPNIISISISLLYADPTPNALQVFLPNGISEDAAITPIPATSTNGLAPSAASLLSDAESVHKLPKNAAKDDAAVLKEKNGEKGVWISADPMPGCVICNIGESVLKSTRLKGQGTN